ncbi:MAG: hypothetical protein UY92_C0006G0072 [Candidatus Magasanikbacteria bacterium GW2011_GWA2_56_11]|uniref:Uncharacterized protein n=1 Tax=Candidatus Magasanikbacteria bacterium GW2011_GWA2_56_11 TaxID=1619044 RepID=A0A0G1YGY9_9BACT|nr:MAG: hypothetical protein UY92_C0006G0072 [Candidatus Magasanikbacteria bacterium GW2011_GWA2_56_11]
MRRLLAFSGCVLAAFAAVALQIGAVPVLPFPWSAANLVLLFLILLIMITDSGAAVWWAFFMHFALELYATTPFGVLLFSGTMTAALLYVLYRTLVTNRTALSALALAACGLIFYRCVYIILVAVFGETLVWPGERLGWLISAYFIELAITAALTIVSFAFLKLILSRFSLTTVSAKHYERR